MTIVNIEIEKPADAIIIAAPYAPAGPALFGTSATANDVGLGGEYTFRMQQTGLGFMPGMRVRASVQDNVSVFMEGVCSSFDTINLTFTSDVANGVGIHDAWNITLAGEPGIPGPTGDPGPPGPQGPPGGAGLDEAPMDGAAYGRSAAAWLRVLKYSGDVVDGGNF
jgi:hypothetical protein